jgi:hypothetical protein
LRRRAGMVRLVAAASVAAAMGSGVDLAHASAISWWNGVSANAGTNTACLSDPPYQEIRMQGYVGYGLWPGDLYPDVGAVWYAHIVISHPGNPCSGGSQTHIEIFPPANTQLAVSAEDPIFCFYRRHDSWGPNFENYGTLFNQGGSCKQNPGIGFRGGYSLDAINPNNPSQTIPWPIPSYSWMEFLVPMRSTAPLNGTSNVTALLNPDIGVEAYPTKPVYVTGDVLFRDGFDGLELYLDLCTLPYTNGC